MDHLFKKPIGRRKLLKYGALSAAGGLLSPLIKISPAGATGEVVFGCVCSLTGFAGMWGKAHVQAVENAVDAFNAAGGFKSLGGAKIRLIIADSQSDAKLQASLTERLINVDKVKLICAACGSAFSMITSAIADKYGCTMVDNGTADPLTERGLKYYFRVACKAADNGRCAVNFASHMYADVGKKFKKVGVLHADDAWGTAAGKAMEAEIAKHPEWEMVGRIAYSPAKLVDATDIISRIKAQGVEVLFPALTPDSGIVIQQAFRSVDYNPQAFVHAQGAPVKKEYVDALGKDAEYVYCATQFAPDMLAKYPQGVQQYCAGYKKRYNEEMDDNAAVSTTVVGIMIDAIERAGSADPDKVREALLKTDLWAGANPYLIAGEGIKFDEMHHNIRAKTNMHQLRNGKLRCVWPDKFKATEPTWPVPSWKERG
jgi:branched-chain amino acid transport system substrate-binding protein